MSLAVAVGGLLREGHSDGAKTTVGIRRAGSRPTLVALGFRGQEALRPVVNCVVTSNHIHLLVKDTGPNIIAQSMQLIAGRTAQEYNQRKNRQGAFWEHRGRKYLWHKLFFASNRCPVCLVSYHLSGANALA